MSSTQHIEYTKKELPKKFFTIGLILLIAGAIGIALGYIFDSHRAAFNNIITLTFLVSIGVASLFLVTLEYISGAVWSTPFRRISEFYSAIVVVLPVVALPLLFNLGSVFHWMHPEVMNADKILVDKAPYLNVDFFTVRVAAFMLLWILFYYIITKNSKKQDVTHDQYLTTKNVKISAVFIPIFAITISFTSFDWLMSLEPHWFSTIFGVYYFSGSLLAALAVVTIAAVWLNERGYLVKGITKDHYYSLGALMFAFTNFWAYIAFSQFLLIWYANLPEETFWFLDRWEGSWMFFTIGLLIVRFLVPYIGLLSQPSKMNPKRLMIMSIIILFAHFYDIYWLAMPNFSKEGVLFGWIEIVFPVFAVGLIFVLFYKLAQKNNIVPIGDPKLKRGIDFRL